MKKQIYSGVKTREIAFPLGGIGSGSISIAGNGRLCDLEIFGRPNHKALAGVTFFAVKAEKDGKCIDARVLNSDSFETRTGFDHYPKSTNTVFAGYGTGPAISTMAGFPHFPETDFTVRFPFAEMFFEYEKFPGTVRMTSFNPFIPLNEEDSSIPAAMFEFEITNNTDDTIDYTLCGALETPLSNAKNVFGGDMSTDMKCIRFVSLDDKDDDGALDSKYNAKNLCLATDCEEVSYQEYLYRGAWNDRLHVFWNDFTSAPYFKNRSYTDTSESHVGVMDTHDTGVMAAHIRLAPGERKTIRFIITWYMRFISNYWNPIPRAENESEEQYTYKNRWKNYYCRLFGNSLECAAYCFSHWERLKSETLLFTDSLYESTIPDEVLDAVASNLSILKSSTILRNADGSILGFEGSHPRDGSCEGNCEHVYNYAYALAHLFPNLEKGIRENEYRYCLGDDGAMAFRMPAPMGRKPAEFFPCADGQLGSVIKIYREFKMSGDIDWLSDMWPLVKVSLDFVFQDNNGFSWDPGKTGILSGRQHNTLDTELYSPNSWLQGFYAAALLCAAEICEILKIEDLEKEYRELFENAKAYLNTELYNGKYFFQKIDLEDKTLITRFGIPTGFSDFGNGVKDLYSYYWNEESGQIKYQIGEGSSVDQALAQWHANNIGLGEIFEHNKLMSALDTIYTENFKKSMRDFLNPFRNFCINDEAGVVICTYPKGAKKPVIPIPYAEECMNGFEYAAACLMIQNGMVDQGLEIVRAVRQRYDGEYRNPFSEMECGTSYVRSLASYTLINAITGLGYNKYTESISFSPLLRFSEGGYFKSFFAANEAFGTIEVGPKYIEMTVLKGEFWLKNFSFFAEPKIVYHNARKLFFKANGNTAVFDVNEKCKKGSKIQVIFD